MLRIVLLLDAIRVCHACSVPFAHLLFGACSASFALAPGAGFNFGHAAVAEIIFTFVLCYVVLCVASVKEPSKDMFGLAIASCVTAGGYAIGAVSGGSLNPAVSFGISSANIINEGKFYNCQKPFYDLHFDQKIQNANTKKCQLFKPFFKHFIVAP